MSDTWEDVAERIGASVDAGTVDALSGVLEAQTAECERLRGLLFVARHGLGSALAHLRYYGGPYASGVDAVSEALCRSDPDATAEHTAFPFADVEVVRRQIREHRDAQR